MPVEIKELVIRMSATETAGAGNPKTATGQHGQPETDQTALVEACVKQVLKILEKKKLR